MNSASNSCQWKLFLTIGESASVSPADSDYGVKSSCWSFIFQRPTNSALTACLSPGDKPSSIPYCESK